MFSGARSSDPVMTFNRHSSCGGNATTNLKNHGVVTAYDINRISKCNTYFSLDLNFFLPVSVLYCLFCKSDMCIKPQVHICLMCNALGNLSTLLVLCLKMAAKPNHVGL